MSRLTIDMAGQRCGSWTVLRQATRREGCGAYWVCQCDCGRVYEVVGTHLRTGRSVECRRCAGLKAAAPRRVPDERRVCVHCGRSTLTVKNSKARECGACERTACRNGRDSNGRPIHKGPRPVLGEIGRGTAYFRNGRWDAKYSVGKARTVHVGRFDTEEEARAAAAEAKRRAVEGAA